MMIWYLLGINIITFFLYGLDKYNAKNKLYRVSEYSLLVFGLFGGMLGGLIGMQIFHHKTLKKKFWFFNILFLIIWILILLQ